MTSMLVNNKSILVMYKTIIKGKQTRPIKVDITAAIQSNDISTFKGTKKCL